MRDLVDVHYPNTHRIRVVLDNLSTLGGISTRPSQRLKLTASLSRLEFHFAPKHASWLNLNMVEIGQVLCGPS